MLSLVLGGPSPPAPQGQQEATTPDDGAHEDNDDGGEAQEVTEACEPPSCWQVMRTITVGLLEAACSPGVQQAAKQQPAAAAASSARGTSKPRARGAKAAHGKGSGHAHVAEAASLRAGVDPSAATAALITSVLVQALTGPARGSGVMAAAAAAAEAPGFSRRGITLLLAAAELSAASGAGAAAAALASEQAELLLRALCQAALQACGTGAAGEGGDDAGAWLAGAVLRCVRGAALAGKAAGRKLALDLAARALWAAGGGVAGRPLVRLAAAVLLQGACLLSCH